MKVYSCETGVYAPITVSGELGNRFKGAYEMLQSTLIWIRRSKCRYLKLFFLSEGLASGSWSRIVQISIQLYSWMPYGVTYGSGSPHLGNWKPPLIWISLSTTLNILTRSEIFLNKYVIELSWNSRKSYMRLLGTTQDIREMHAVPQWQLETRWDNLGNFKHC